MNRSQVEKSDYLISLVGTSPMPNLIGTFTRTKDDGKIFLVYTKATNEIAKKLKYMIKDKCEKNNKNIEVSLNLINAFDDPQDVSVELNREIRNIFKQFERESNKKQIELNFTGGTKVMSALSYEIFYRECNKLKIKGVLTYLDGEKSKMICRNVNSESSEAYDYSKENETIPITIEDIANIHLDKDKKFECNTYEASEFAKSLFNTVVENISNRDEIILLTNSLYSAFPDTSKVGSQMLSERVNNIIENNVVRIKDFESADEIVNSYKLIISNNKKSKYMYKHVARRLKGLWFEEVILNLLENAPYVDGVASNGEVKNYPKGKENILEVDILILKNHKLYVLSITTDDTLEINKKKLYEVKERANSLGGSEVGIGLLTFYDNGKKLKSIVKELWENDENDSVKIFDWYDLPNLEEEFKCWICGGVDNE